MNACVSVSIFVSVNLYVLEPSTCKSVRDIILNHYLHEHSGQNQVLIPLVPQTDVAIT